MEGMLQLDDVQLYDLSEAGSRLFSDAARLTRLARLRRVPAAQMDGVLGLPVPWVDAASGQSGSDPEALAEYWLQRLAPPATTARRPRRDPSRLPVEDLLSAEEAAGRLFASPAALERLELDGTLPGLRLEGRTHYDAQLVDLLARADEGEEVRRKAARRRSEVLAWARFEYAAPAASTQATSGEALPTFDALRTGAAPMPELGQQGAEGAEAASAPTEAAEAPTAFEIPTDLGLADLEPLEAAGATESEALGEPKPPSKLMRTEGFDTVDED